MNCPECGTIDCYYGLMGYSCLNIDCIHFDSRAKTKMSNNVIDQTSRTISHAGSAPYITQNGNRFLVDENKCLVRCLNQPYRVSEKYPDVVGCQMYVTSPFWFACHFKNELVGTKHGAYHYFSYGQTFNQAVENYVKKWNFQYEK